MEEGENLLFVLAALMWNGWDGVCGCTNLFCGQNESHNEAVKPQHLSKDQDQNHAYEKPGLLGSASNSGITHNPDGKPGCQPAQSHAQTSTKMQETPVEEREGKCS